MLKKLILVLCLGMAAYADSPITSTSFWERYTDVPEVAHANATHRLDAGLEAYLIGANPIDRKAAVINALSWEDKTSPRNFNVFRQRLAKKHKVDPRQVESKLTADEAFCLGYLTALDSYNSPTLAVGLMRQARRDRPRSYTIAALTGVVESQVVFDEQSKIWGVFNKAISAKNLQMDMRADANEDILEYMRLYKDDAQ